MAHRVIGRIVEVGPNDLALLKRAYVSVYKSAFPIADERESLVNMAAYLRRKQAGTWGNGNYHIGITLLDGRPVAMSVSDYFARTRTGMIEFLAVDPAHRGHGTGQELLRWTENRLRQDAMRLDGSPLRAVLGEMDDPFRRRAREGELNPFRRCEVWDRWGYRALDFPYIQPALSSGQKPVSHLVLIAKIFLPRPSALRAQLVFDTVAEYLRLAMRIPRPERHADFLRMHSAWDARGGKGMVVATPLAEYVGRRLPGGERLNVTEVISGGEALYQVLRIYDAAFRDPSTRVSRADFLRILSSSRGDADKSASAWFRYHLWALRIGTQRGITGFSSFFTMRDAGFGGYLALRGPKTRRRGALRALFARMEEQFMDDSRSVHGWWIEVDPTSRRLIRHFARHGFRRLAVTYWQPISGTDSDEPEAYRPLALLYKPFGRMDDPPAIRCREFLRWHGDLLRAVYGLGSRAATYRKLQSAMCARLGGKAYLPLRAVA